MAYNPNWSACGGGGAEFIVQDAVYGIESITVTVDV